MTFHTIREARQGEAEAVCTVLEQSFREYVGILDPPSGVFAETVASLADRIARNEILVCDVAGELVGCAFCTPDDSFLYVGRFGVLPEWRQSGVGSLLLAAAENRARALGYRHARLNVRASLCDLQQYYERRGYRPVEFLSHEGYAGPTYMQMEKVLDEQISNRSIGQDSEGKSRCP